MPIIEPISLNRLFNLLNKYEVIGSVNAPLHDVIKTLSFAIVGDAEKQILSLLSLSG